MNAAGFTTIGVFFVGGLMHPTDHFSFIVALTDFHVKTKLLTPLRAQATQGFKILLAIHVGLTHAKASRFGPLTTTTLVMFNSLVITAECDGTLLRRRPRVDPQDE